MAALLNNVTVAHDQDQIRVTDGRKPMGDDKAGATLHQPIHGLLDQDAISVLRKASPLALKHPLGKEQITILVPIAYRLES